MPSSPSTLLKVELQAAGENSNSWGTLANATLSRLEDGIAGRTPVVLSANYTLTDTQYVANEARAMVLDVSGAGGFSITIPNRAKGYLIRNASSGIATITTGSGTTVAVAAGVVEWVFSTGANVVFRLALPAAATSGLQPLAANLTALAALTLAADTLPYGTGAGAMTTTTLTTAGRSLVSGIDAAAQRTTLGLGSIATFAETTAAEFRANTAARALSTDKIWTAADYVALTDAVTVAVDMATGFNFTVTLAGNRTLGNPTNPKNGQTGVIAITQDATGTRTLAYGANWKFANATAPTLSTAAGTRDLLFYQVLSSTAIYANLVKAV